MQVIFSSCLDSVVDQLAELALWGKPAWASSGRKGRRATICFWYCFGTYITKVGETCMCNTFALICHSLISGASFTYKLPQQLQEQHALDYLSSWAYSAVLLAQPWCCAVSAGRHALHVMFDSFLFRCLRKVSSRTRWCQPYRRPPSFTSRTVTWWHHINYPLRIRWEQGRETAEKYMHVHIKIFHDALDKINTNALTVRTNRYAYVRTWTMLWWLCQYINTTVTFLCASIHIESVLMVYHVYN